MANQLDIRIYQQRAMLYKVMNGEARALRESCTEASEAVAALDDFYDRLYSASYEVRPLASPYLTPVGAVSKL